MDADTQTQTTTGKVFKNIYCKKKKTNRLSMIKASDAYEQYDEGCNRLLWPLGLLLERAHCPTHYSFPFMPFPFLDFFPLDLRPDLEP